MKAADGHPSPQLKVHVPPHSAALDRDSRASEDDPAQSPSPHPRGDRAGVSFVDAPHTRFPCSKLKLDNLFLQWLSIPESQSLVLSLVEDARRGRPLQGPSGSGSSMPAATPASPLSPSSSQALFSAAAPAVMSPHPLPSPPVSPQKSNSVPSSAPHSPTHRKDSLDLSAALQARGKHVIPRFYWPGGRPLADDERRAKQARLHGMYARNSGDLNLAATKEVVKEIFELPGVLGPPLFYKLVAPGSATISSARLQDYIEQHNVLQADPDVRMFDVLRDEARHYVTKGDLKSMLTGVLLSHPGLEFLQETPEFQDRYAETVIFRIFYHLDRLGSGKLTLRDLRRGNLLGALRQLDEEEDVNKVLRYFSYEHFYVIYCKFWELDSDHDFLLDRDDLLRYGNHALTYRVVDRIFSHAARPLASGVEGKLGYEDFVWFILSEEDKASDVALEYWFRCCDLDCDGCLRANELLYFYEEQLHRMDCLSQEPVSFEDVLCQLHDMLQPAQEGCFTLRDLKHSRALAGTLFNTLFNLNKFVAFETRDPFIVRQERETAHLSDWERFARQEYVRLAMEEEPEPEEGQPGGPESDAKLFDEPF